MHKPFNPSASDITWNHSATLLEAWRAGQTGYPLVDAGMRQLAATGWMHNRTRMVAASFLAKDLLLDWRLGERHFMLSLADGDFASNNLGWQFAASVGVDPQPWFRVFNPLRQSRRFDPRGDYIRKWIPELRDVAGDAVHEPHARAGGKGVEGYPRPVVVHREMREKALARYREGMGGDGDGG
ncbi:hypothetical protein MBLNU459_g0097t1 [Dothideomycetes sp. NU459]